jgi:hypothetical protein
MIRGVVRWVALVGISYAGVQNLPDVARYLRMREMDLSSE